MGCFHPRCLALRHGRPTSPSGLCGSEPGATTCGPQKETEPGGELGRVLINASGPDIRFRGGNRTSQNHVESVENVKGFGRRPIAAVRQAPRPSSESVQGRNPREAEAGSMPAPYGDLIAMRRAAEAVKAPGYCDCGPRIGSPGLNERCWRCVSAPRAIRNAMLETHWVEQHVAGR